MKIDDFEITKIGDRKIIVRGIGKMLYQDGLPICMAVEAFMKHGIEISWLHIADELQKNGWKSSTILSRVEEDFSDFADLLNKKLILASIEKFINSEYDQQRQMIFDYLFKGDLELAKNYFVRRVFDDIQNSNNNEGDNK